MRVWTARFTALFIGVALIGGLLAGLVTLFLFYPYLIARYIAQYLSATYGYGLVFSLALIVLSLVGVRFVRSRLLRVGLCLQASLSVISLLLYLLDLLALRGVLPYMPEGGMPLGFSLTILLALLPNVVLICLSYGIARWRSPRDLLLTLAQVVLSLGGLALLLELPSDLPRVYMVQSAFSGVLAAFGCWLLLLRPAAWRARPGVIALLLASRALPLLVDLVRVALLRLVDFKSLSALFLAFQPLSFLSAFSGTLFLLGLLLLIQTERQQRQPVEEPAGIGAQST